MPTILITRKHKRPLPEARASIERIAKGIAKRFSIDYGWTDNTMDFSRAGVDGHIALTKSEVRVKADISFLMLPIKGAIEDEIKKHLDAEFG